MTHFISLIEPLKKILKIILRSEELHVRWLNTLSYLENCGARKIAACEHPTQVKEEMLKHAAEEFRHAHYLKRQIERVSSRNLQDYSLPFLLGGTASLHYLKALDLGASRYLSRLGLSKTRIKEAAYLLVTYAIELRAAELYPIYDEQLRQIHSKVTVKSILLEEKEHLMEMRQGLEGIPSGMVYAEHICAIEADLCRKWLQNISKTIQI
jgi:hypothetical protein